MIVGDELIVLAKVEGNYANLEGSWSAVPCLEGCGPLHQYARQDCALQLQVTRVVVCGMDEGAETSFPAAAYDPVSGKVIMLGVNGLWVYDPVAKTRTTAIDSLRTDAIRDESGLTMHSGALGINQNLVYFPPDQNLYYFKNTGEVFRVSLDRSDFNKTQITKVATTGIPFTGSEFGAAYDSRNQVIGMGPTNNVFYAFNPVTRAWSSKNITGGAPGSCCSTASTTIR